VERPKLERYAMPEVSFRFTPAISKSGRGSASLKCRKAAGEGRRQGLPRVEVQQMEAKRKEKRHNLNAAEAIRCNGR